MIISGAHSFPGSFEIPPDNSDRDAAGVNTPFESLADRTVFLRNVGFRRVSQWIYDNDAATPTWSWNSTGFAGNTTASSDWMVNVTDTMVDDIIKIDAVIPVGTVPASTNVYFRFAVTHGYLSGGTQANVPGFVRTAQSTLLVLSTYSTVTAIGTSRFRLLGRYSGTGPTFTVAGFGSILATLLRPTGSSA